jgi:DNA repair protein RecO (recombination protein O)
MNGGAARTRAGPGPHLRVEHQPGFVLHATPWRETSLVIEVLARDHGRLALVARGAKRPTSQFRGLLAPFAPLALSWSGRGEVRTLIRAEWLGGLAPPRGDGLLAAFYLNELVVRLLARGDPHEALFADYVTALHALARIEHADRNALDAALRGFELDLLRETGWLPSFDAASAPRAGQRYQVDPEHGVLAHAAPAHEVRAQEARPYRMPAHAAGGGDHWTVSGAAVQALATRDWTDPDATAECRHLLRALIAYRLGGRPLNTRRILADLRRLGGD